jgi:CSLREA domain-containing protein
VNTTADHDDGACEPLGAGDCTLREGISVANEMDGPDTIAFDIPADDTGYDPDVDAWVIEVSTELPEITDDDTVLDASTQGAEETSALGSEPDGPWVPGGPICKYAKIQVKFTHSTTGFTAKASSGTLHGFKIYGSGSAPAVTITGAKAVGNAVSCNTITNSNMYTTTKPVNDWRHTGVLVTSGASYSKIDRNWIHCSWDGVRLRGASHHSVLTGNYIGGVGQGAIANDGTGVRIDEQSHHNTVGDPNNASLGNMISGNEDGVTISGPQSTQNVVANNRIGVAPTSDTPLPNKYSGVGFYWGAHGNTIGPGNVIANGGRHGIAWWCYGYPGAAGANVATWNSIYDNALLGIQNPAVPPPTITVASGMVVSGTTKPACASCSIEIFTNPSSSAKNPAEGKTPIGKTTTQSDGTWSWSGSAPAGEWLTATVTKAGDTSQFSTPRRAATVLKGHVCPPGPTLLNCLPHIPVELIALVGPDSRVVDWVVTNEDGSFEITDEMSTEPPTAYVVVMADPKYRVETAEAGPGGEAMPDGSIRYDNPEAKEYSGNVFRVDIPERNSLWVNTTADHDDGNCGNLPAADCTLREALRSVGEHKAALIEIRIPESDPGYEDGVWTISPTSPLPELVGDGLMVSALPGLAPEPPGAFTDTCKAGPLVVLDGTFAPAGTSGVVMKGNRQVVVGWMITNWPADGVRVSGDKAYESVVACNYIVDNLGDGVRIEAGANHNLVGGNLGGNLISANSGNGVVITGEGSDFNRLHGNLIGADASGNKAWGNVGHGVARQPDRRRCERQQGLGQCGPWSPHHRRCRVQRRRRRVASPSQRHRRERPFRSDDRRLRYRLEPPGRKPDRRRGRRRVAARQRPPRRGHVRRHLREHGRLQLPAAQHHRA